jgi:hypothetical protein
MLLNKYDVEKKWLNFVLFCFFFLWPIFTNLNGGKTSTTFFPKNIKFKIDVFPRQLKDLNNFATP